MPGSLLTFADQGGLGANDRQFLFSSTSLSSNIVSKLTEQVDADGGLMLGDTIDMHLARSLSSRPEQLVSKKWPCGGGSMIDTAR